MKNLKTLTKTKFKFPETKKAYFLLYTAIFLVVAPLIFMSFIQQDKSFVWISTGGGKDGYQQHYMTFMYFGQWLREIARTLFTEGRLEIPLWDFSIGYGADVLTTFHYYAFGDPLNLISAVVPSKFAEYAYTGICVLRLYLSGITFSLFCFKMNKSRTATLAGTIAYTFSGYSIFNCVRHVFFMNPMIYLPLVFIGIEKIFKKEKPLLFVSMIFLTTISNFYFLYMTVVAVVIYVIIRYFTMERQKSVKDFFIQIGKFAGGGLLGVGMASAVLLPVLNVFLSSGRHSATGGANALFYEEAVYYEKIIAGFFGGMSPSYYTCVGFAAPLFVALVVMFTSRKKYTSLKIGTAVCAVMMIFPFFGRMMNGFSYASNRWTFIFAWLMSFVLASVWEDMMALSKKKIIALSVAAVAYAGFLLVFNNLINTAALISLIIIFISVVLVILVSKVDLVKSHKRAVSIVLVVLVTVSVTSNGYHRYIQGDSPYITQFLEYGEAFEGIENSSDKAAAKLVDENHFARNEQGAGSTMLNACVVTEATGTQYYWSLENGVMSSYLFDADRNAMLSQMYNGLDGRTYLEALTSVKYYFTSSSNPVPAGFTKHSKVNCGGKKIRIYENENALPLGYTYSSYIDFEEYENMTSVERQRAMLQGVVLENTDENPSLNSYSEIQPEYTHQEMKTTLKTSKNVVQMEDGSFVVNKDGAKMTLTFEGLDNSETYFYVEDMFAESRNKYELYMDDCEEVFSKEEFAALSEKKQKELEEKDRKDKKTSKENAKLPVYATSETAVNRLQYYNIDYKYATGQEDYLVNMGYNEEGLKELTISFPSAGVYKFGKMAVICQPMDDLKEKTDALKENILENEKITANSVEGDITLEEDKILCLSIPYSTGWTATVDGEKVDLLQANKAFMAIPLTAGTHNIKLNYSTPLMKIGICVSMISFGIFIGMATAYISIRRKRKK